MADNREDPPFKVLADKYGRAFLGEKGIHYGLPEQAKPVLATVHAPEAHKEPAPKKQPASKHA